MIKEFTFINFFRALAAFWVLSAHCMIWGGWYEIPLPSAKIAVDLFMMISGYLMVANAFARNAFEPLSTGKNWLKFWLRRFFRLAPAYYVSLMLAVVMNSYYLSGYHELQKLNPARWGASGSVYDPTRIEYTLTNVLLHLSFLFGLHPSYSFSTFLPDWSLSLEMQFYVVFPALMLLMQKMGFLKIALCVGIPTFIIGFLISKSVHYYEPSLLCMKLNYFIAGILIFRVLTEKSRNKRFALAFCAVLLVSLDIRYGKQLLVLPLLLLSMLMLGWLEANNRTPAWLLALINSRFTRFASDTSYGVYLFHGFFISAFGLIISGQTTWLALTAFQRVIMMFLFVLPLAYLTAYIIYRFVELPGIHLGKQMIQRLTPNN